MKYKNVLSVLCDIKTLLKLKAKFYYSHNLIIEKMMEYPLSWCGNVWRKERLSSMDNESETR